VEKPIRVLWVDEEHMYCWKPALEDMREIGFQVSELQNLNHACVLHMCSAKDVVVIHCGTLHPTATLRELLVEIKRRYPRIKIGLETRCAHPVVQDLVDFYVEKPIRLKDLVSLMRCNAQ
jgi:hypothetical protein